MRQIHRSIPASFRGQTQIINGTELVTSNLRGTIGRDHFTGTSTGTLAGTQFQGGNVYLSNGTGNVQLQLGPAIVVRVGKSSRQEVPLVVVAASGKYAPFEGTTGLLTKWNTPARANATARISGFLNG
jgi:hypothetical protein